MKEGDIIKVKVIDKQGTHVGEGEILYIVNERIRIKFEDVTSPIYKKGDIVLVFKDEVC